MLYVGIDIAKDKHDCAVIGADGEILVSPFTIKNDILGYRKLLAKVFSLGNKNDLKFGLEETGHYGINLINYLQRNGCTVETVNPLLTARQRQADSLRKAKTDKIDSIQIAKMLRSGVGFYPKLIIPQDAEDLKSLSRYRKYLVSVRAKDKTSVRRLINILFPELEEIFSHNVHSKTLYSLLAKYPGRQYISNARVSSLIGLLPKHCNNLEGAAAVKEIAKNSIGIVSEAKSYELKETVARIIKQSEKILELEQKISDVMSRINTYIDTIPGVGSVSAAIIVGEIGLFSRFSSADKILAYAGIIPTIYQSGKYNGINRSKMEKRGSSYLRSALFLATEKVCRYEPTFNQYLKKRRAEGKHYYVAISNAVRKLVRLMYALETEQRAYSR